MSHVDQFRRAAVAGGNLRRQSSVVVVGEHLEAQPGLTEMIDAGRAFGVELGGVDGGKEQGGENPDDGDDHQHFDQGESDDLPAVPWRFHALSILSTGDATLF